MELRQVISYMNMRKLSEEAGISYDIIRNYSCGRKRNLEHEEYNAVVDAIKRILGGLK